MVTNALAEFPSLGERTQPLSVSIRRDGERTIVDLGGELDLASAPILNDFLKSLGSQADAVVYDLAHLTFIDVLGLRSLMAHEKEPGQGISVRAPSFQVRRLLEICQLESIIEGSPNQQRPDVGRTGGPAAAAQQQARNLTRLGRTQRRRSRSTDGTQPPTPDGASS